MNWLDLLIGAIVLASFVSGVMKGLIRIGIGFAAMLVGFLCAAWFYGLAGEIVRPYVASKAISGFLGFLIIFATVLAAGALLSMLLTRMFKWAGLSWLDRFLGGVFGCVRGVLLATILVMLIAAFSSYPPPRVIVESRIAPHLIGVSHVLSAMTPNEIKSGFRKSYDELKKLWKNTVHPGVKKLPRHEI